MVVVQERYGSVLNVEDAMRHTYLTADLTLYWTYALCSRR
jgi:hypothetical protein